MSFRGRDLESLSRGASVASSYSRKHSRSRSRGPLVPPTQESDDARSGWGGSSGGSVAGGPVGFMPDANNDAYPDFPCAPHAPAWLWEKYRAYTIELEVTPARRYAEKHTTLQKTASPSDGKRLTHVWCYDSKTTMWKPVQFDMWILEYVQSECADEISMMVDTLADLLRRSEELGLDKETIAKWKKVLGKAKSAQLAMGKVSGATNVANAAAILLRDDLFFEMLDANRFLLSFKNGVIDLSKADIEVRARTAADMLSYCLPYDYAVDADTSDIETFVESLMSTSAARHVLQLHVGYWATGLTTEKRFYQLSTPPNYGKTTFLEIVSRALGDYVVPPGMVPVSELMKKSHGEGFEDSLAKALMKYPRPRVIFFDETDGRELNETIINAASSGYDNIRLALRKKHTSAELVVALHGKFVFAGNQVLKIPATASGTAFRNTAPPFDTCFIDADVYDEALALSNVKPKDIALCGRLLSDDGRAGVIKWIVAGAMGYISGGRSIPSNPAWDGKRLELLVQGDPFVKHISETYTLTGSRVDRVIFQRAMDDFSHRHKNVRYVDVGLAAAFDALRGILEAVEWEVPEPYYGSGQPPEGHPSTLVRGYSGLRVRRGGDPSYADCIIAARARFIEERRPVEV